MPTIYQSSVREIVKRGLAECPQFGAALANTLDLIRQGAFPGYFVDAITQPGESPLGIYDAYTVAYVDCLVRLKRIGVLVITIGQEPGRDVEEVGNNEGLGKVPFPFGAEFKGGPGCDDGAFFWTEPVEMLVARTTYEGGWDDVEFQPATLPLEVGATNYGRTLAHIIQNGGVARWPYHSDKIVVFRTTDSFVRDSQRTAVKTIADASSPDYAAFFRRRKRR